MKIIGFLQIKNEVSSGHLLRFLEWNQELWDSLYVYDDGSNDGTVELLSEHADYIYRGKGNSFGEELLNKQILLKRIQEDFAEGDAILWLDADEVLYASRDQLKELITDTFNQGYDSISLPLINLWKSEHWYRTDHLFDALRNVRIWKLSSKIFFPDTFGLHGELFPRALHRTFACDSLAVLHFGFASYELIIEKYCTYYRHWQTGSSLYRLIDEEGLELQPITERLHILGERYPKLGFSDLAEKPDATSPQQWQLSARSKILKIRTDNQPIVTLVSLIFGSTSWLSFQYGELLRLARDLPRGQAQILFVANDATPEVLSFLVENGIPHIAISTKVNEDEWFINSVYRAYNQAVVKSETEYVLLVNSDMAYAPGTLSNLLKNANEKTLLAGRLVELGIMPTGLYGIEKDFGNSPTNYRSRDFHKYARKIQEQRLASGGLFMPLLVNRKTFLSLGGFPEGNIKAESLNKYLDSGIGEIAKKGEKLIPGDAAFMQRAKLFGIDHLTDFSSITYHFQAGEMRNKKDKTLRSGIAIVNDSITGINGEKVLWGELGEKLKHRGIQVFEIQDGLRVGKLATALQPLFLWAKAWILLSFDKRARVVFSNATYQIPLVGKWRNVVLRQDMPKQKYLKALQRQTLKSADLAITNDAQTLNTINSPEKIWMLLPLAEIWWNKSSQKNDKDEFNSIEPIKGLFVGALNETKGWSGIQEVIASFPQIVWSVVSKYDEQLKIDKAIKPSFSSQLSSEKIRHEMTKADFLIVNSPYETQCLVALEAASQNTPVLTTPTGILGNFGIGKHDFGLVGKNVSDLVSDYINNRDSFAPRKFLEEKLMVLGNESWELWLDLLGEQLEQTFLIRNARSRLLNQIDRIRGWFVVRWRYLFRAFVIPYLINLKNRLSRVHE